MRLKKQSLSKKCCVYFSHPLDDDVVYEASPEALGPADIVVETQAKTAAKLCNYSKEKNEKLPSEKYNFK